MKENLQFPESKNLDLNLYEDDRAFLVAKALASHVRIEILKAICQKSMNVKELAQKLDLPVSSTALDVRILEEADLIRSETQPGVRGKMKLCHRKLDSLAISLMPTLPHDDSTLTMELNVGYYSLAENIAPTCGLASGSSSIGEDDNPRSFYHQDHFNAQIIWFKHGYLIYHFGILAEQRKIEFLWLELSFEVCSEAPMYRDPWKSDISVTINGCRIGTWTSPADFGGRRGILNPSWWSDLSTQYGMLKTWRVDATGTYIDKAPVSGVTIHQLDLAKHNAIAVGIGVLPDAENVGGINLFGKEFGDFSQGIVLKIGYRLVDENRKSDKAGQ